MTVETILKGARNLIAASPRLLKGKNIGTYDGKSVYCMLGALYSFPPSSSRSKAFKCLNEVCLNRYGLSITPTNDYVPGFGKKQAIEMFNVALEFLSKECKSKS